MKCYFSGRFNSSFMLQQHVKKFPYWSLLIFLLRNCNLRNLITESMNKASICIWYLFCFIFLNYDDKICIIKISKDFPVLTKFLIISSSISRKYSGACRKREHLRGKQGTFERSRFYEKDLSLYFRSSRFWIFYKIHFIENFTKFTRKRLCRSLFFIQVARLKTASFSKKV